MDMFSEQSVCAPTDHQEEKQDTPMKRDNQNDTSTDDDESDFPDGLTSDDDDDDDFEPEDQPLWEARELSHSWCQGPAQRFARNSHRMFQQSFLGPMPQRTGMAPQICSWKPPSPDVQELSQAAVEEKLDVGEALRRYIQKLQGKSVPAPSVPTRRPIHIGRENRQANDGGMRLPESLLPRNPTEVEEGLRQEAASSTCKTKETELGHQGSFNTSTSNGKNTWLCQHCNLPMGDFSYKRGGKSMHGECLAQILVHEMKDKEEARFQKDKQRKEFIREEYGIGWQAAKQVPCNHGAVSKLVHRDVPQGMVCLVVNNEQSISLAGTIDPAAAVNLEYLSICLKVRCREGHEPMFSLDPVDPQDCNSMQSKVFQPEWLAGTSVGEVLFQADYHLKELSMGEYQQPVLGMRSCFDHAEMEGQDKEWNAREWFIVRKADVQITENNVLIPYVKMGVEAREQFIIDDVLDDAPITRTNHPMVKFADDFTRNFDLIAERKSVVFHLRELAKAAVMAKFLLECPYLQLEESWLRLANEKEDACSLEVPQIWNQRTHSLIQVKDGKIEDTDGLARSRGIYGGVSFGLGKFPELGAAVSAVMPGQLSAMRAGRAPGLIASAVEGEAPVHIDLGYRAAGVVESGRLPMRMLDKFVNASEAAKDRIQTKFGKKVRGGALSLSAAAAPALPPPPTAPVKRFLFPYKGLSTNIATKKTAPGLTKGDLSLLGERLGLVTTSARKPQTALVERPKTGVSKAAIGGGTGYGLGGFRAAKRPAPIPAITAGRAAPAATSAAASADLQGVDLRLDRFDLSTPKRVVLEATPIHSLDSCVAMGDAFWACLDKEPENFQENFQDDNLQLLKSVFHPNLSDRRAEGDRFIPPVATDEYIGQLREMVRHEEALRQQRKKVFFSEQFSEESPGSVFPTSWQSSFGFSKVRMHAQVAAHGALHARPDYMLEVTLLSHLMKSAEPSFDKNSEDGTRFRIYRLGALIVRTVQEVGEEEVIGAVFSHRAPKKASQSQDLEKENAKIMKVTEYVEHAYQPAPVAKILEPVPEPDAEPAPIVKAEEPGLFHRYYIVLETESGSMIRSEQLEDGYVTFAENPEDLEDRNSLAKVIRTTQSTAGVAVREFKKFQSSLARRAATREDRKNYSGSAYKRALGNVSATEVMQAWQEKKLSGEQVPLNIDAIKQTLSNKQLELMSKCFTWN